MSVIKKSLLVSVFLISVNCLFAQNKDILDSIKFYGMLQVQLAAFNNGLELQENSPQMGFALYRQLPNGWSVNAKLEFGLHLINGTNFNNDANTTVEFLANPFKKKDVFSSRLAYFGIANEKLGSLTFGKQWGVYYDIAGFTDNFSLFGGAANGVYAGGTDGGWKGTGRADNAVLYRNNIGPVEIAAQTQLFANTESFGVSLQYHAPIGLTLGAAYNDASIAVPVRQVVLDIGDRTTNFISGINFKNEKYYAAFTFSVNDDAIVVVDTAKAVSFPTYGYELSLGFVPNENWTFEGGFNLIDQRSDQLVLRGRYHLFQVILGANYYFTPQTSVYLIGRLSDTNYSELGNFDNAIALGFRYGFDFGYKKFGQQTPK